MKDLSDCEKCFNICDSTKQSTEHYAVKFKISPRILNGFIRKNKHPLHYIANLKEAYTLKLQRPNTALKNYLKPIWNHFVRLVKADNLQDIPAFYQTLYSDHSSFTPVLKDIASEHGLFIQSFPVKSYKYSWFEIGIHLDGAKKDKTEKYSKFSTVDDLLKKQKILIKMCAIIEKLAKYTYGLNHLENEVMCKFVFETRKLDKLHSLLFTIKSVFERLGSEIIENYPKARFNLDGMRSGHMNRKALSCLLYLITL